MKKTQNKSDGVRKTPTVPPVAVPLSERLAFTAREAAGLLGVDTYTVYRLIARGLLKSSSALRNKLIPREELDRLLQA